MTIIDVITQACESVGARPPKITPYANCWGVAFRNSAGQRILVTIDPSSSHDTIKHKIAAAYKIKVGNVASDEAMSKVFSRSKIQQHQETKKEE